MSQVGDAVQDCSMKSSFLPWMVCLSATLFFFYEFIQGNMFASIASSIMQAYHIEADKMTYLSSAYYLANVLFLFVAGVILDRFSIKNTMLVAMLLCVASTFVLANSHSFYLALLCRFATGIGSAFCFLGPVRLASHWFPPKRMALVTGIIVTLAMTGGMLAQYPLTKLVALIGWRYALQGIGLLGVVMLLLMFFGIQEKQALHTQESAKAVKLAHAFERTYLNPQYVSAALYTSLMNMAIAVFGAMMGILYLEQRLAVNTEMAAMVNGMLFLGAIVGSPLVGWVSDKVGLRILPMKIGALISLAVMLAILYLPVSLPVMAVLFFLLGLFTSAQVISYALIAESSSPLLTATAISVVSILTQGGYLVYQNIFSALLTSFNSVHMVNAVPVYSLAAYQYAAIILPLGLVFALVMTLGLKETYCKRTGGC